MATTTRQAQAAITTAALDRVVEGQVGYTESGGADGHSGNITKYGAAYGMNGVAWCSLFVWWCFRQLGVNLAKTITGGYASAELAMEGWAKHGWKIVKNPKFMDVVFFHFEGEHAGANHTGFVIAADAHGVHTIEGNTSGEHKAGSQVNGGEVARRYRPYSVIIGYGRYPFAAGTQPAVPKVKPIQPGHKSYPTLHYGMGSATPSNDVKRLQYLLHVPVTGTFDRETETHVKQAQFNRHLKQDGIAGPATLLALGF